MALSKIQSESMNLADTYAFTGTVSGTVSGSGAFLARNNSTSWTTVADGGICAFNDDSTEDSFDTDSCYNTTTYKFVAPATGVYFFHYSVYTANSDTMNGFTFLKNSAKVASQHNNGEYFSFNYGENDDHIQTSSLVINLSSGDTIAVCAATASDYHTGHSHWGGCRLA